MDYIIQALLSFIAAVAFGVLFNAPRRMLIHCGIVGTVGWLVFSITRSQTDDQVVATFLGAFTIALLSHVFARRRKMPMILFSVSGIIVLVPGSSAYNAMRHVVEQDYLMAIELGTRALLISGAIAMGLVFAEIIMQIYLKIYYKLVKKKKTEALVDLEDTRQL
ncbi:threonine/serine exporter family protein [Chryseomicrobium sp. FSL W7-1435]|uniref:threonine/serine exporter family protein n=1 Tax=Chryseomicrobium sp. FSL W7-1435 TaxID=2921704 RepID=UPI00315AF85A